MEKHIDIIIYGAGIAGLWTLARLKALGYDALLLEKGCIGGTQSIASQGIIHSGLKYALGGKVNKVAAEISAMPEIWRACLAGDGPVDLSAAKVHAQSQQLLIPGGLISGITKMITKQALGNSVKEIETPADIHASGFKGSVVDMQELVLDIPSVIRALAEPYQDCIRQAGDHGITAKTYIHTAADGNAEGEIQRRPLLMGFLKPAPFPLYAHLVGASEKPVATITTHHDQDGAPLWYIGAGVAERDKSADPSETIHAAQKAFKKYFPALDITNVEWASLPIDRIEGKGDGWMPDTPTLHQLGDSLYGWPTKLTFAPLLVDMIVERLEIEPSGQQSDFSALPTVGYNHPPWDGVQWTNEHSDRAA